MEVLAVVLPGWETQRYRTARQMNRERLVISCALEDCIRITFSLVRGVELLLVKIQSVTENNPTKSGYN